MKIVIGLVVFISLALLLGWGIQSCQSGKLWIKDVQSGIGGIQRVVTLYDLNGKPIKTWKGNLNIRTEGGSADWINPDGTRTIISGWFVIEEIK